MARFRVSKLNHSDYYLSPRDAENLVSTGRATLIAKRHIQMNQSPTQSERNYGDNIAHAHHYKGYSGGMALIKISLLRKCIL